MFTPFFSCCALFKHFFLKTARFFSIKEKKRKEKKNESFLKKVSQQLCAYVPICPRLFTRKFLPGGLVAQHKLGKNWPK
jgi:hypothetical protein